MLTLSFSYATVNNHNTSTYETNTVDVSSLDFDVDGNIVNFDFATAFCTETRNDVTYTATVGCFLCSPQRAQERCARVLSRRIDAVNPEVIY
ncbi:hypothetical protein [uncultured Winogradskyella sp.]|uniref:hypothetical protein n=1 Tax=uncultured Winogradskyella sp. TaxID=395353 RepID=UPI0026394AD3|nr:hypothetical protein [uncultured Winogradskyella sp.]